MGHVTMESSGHKLLALPISNELREKLQTIADKVDANNTNRLYDYIRKVLSNHIVDCEIKGDLE